MEQKKIYAAPTIRKVQLSINNAILANCHSSPNITPLTGINTCTQVSVGCFNPPTTPGG